MKDFCLDCPEAIGWVEGSFYNVLSKREGWRGRVEEEGCVKREEWGEEEERRQLGGWRVHFIMYCPGGEVGGAG